MSGNHTPGPWSWDAGDTGEFGPRPYCDVYVDGGEKIIASVNDRFSKEEGRANARLIAAAPEMLEALRQIGLRCGPTATAEQCAELARAAIARIAQ